MAGAGIIGAGTNNARLAGMLRNLSGYYAKEPTLLLLVRVAQGLVHMGKGLLGLAPYHTDGQLASGARPGTRSQERRVGLGARGQGPAARGASPHRWPAHLRCLRCTC